MKKDPVLLPEVLALPPMELIAYIRVRAENIVARTPGTEDASWDDPEDYQLAAIELAHAVHRLTAPTGIECACRRVHVHVNGQLLMCDACTEWTARYH